LAVVACEEPSPEGLAMLRKVATKFPALPIVCLANAASKDFIVGAFRAGAKDFLEKPIAREALRESVNRLLEAVPQNTTISSLATNLLRFWRKVNFSSFPSPLISLKRWAQRGGAVVSHLSSRLSTFKNTEILDKNEGVLVEDGHPSVHIESTVETKPKKSTTDSIEPLYEEKKARSLLRVHCLGRFQFFLNDQLVNHWPCRKGRELFAYLTVNHNKRTHREILMDSFWPASSPDSARNSLNVALHGIRTRLRELALSHEIILYDEECYFLNPEIEIWLDVEEFLHHWRIAQRVEQEKHRHEAIANYELAANLYQGDFMEDDLYESWPAQQRENLKEVYLVILDRLGEHYALDGHPDTAISLCEKILEKDICREDVYRRLMRCHYRLGQRDKALRVFQKCSAALKKELEAEPTRATIQLYEQVKQDCLKKA
jgi:DNA-binding SARP family transcriptional activator